VHPITFDASTFARALPGWLGPAARGVLALDRAAPGAYAMVAAACPDATLVDAALLLLRLGLSSHALPFSRVADADDLVRARRARAAGAAAAMEVDTWWFRTPEAVRMVTGQRAAAPTSVVGDVTIAERTLEAAVEHFPARGRLAVDRITISERERVQRFLPGLEIVDAGAIVLAGSTPRGASETLALREGYRRTEVAVDAARLAVAPGATERDVAVALAQAGGQLGLDPHIEHVVTVVPRDREIVPWLRGGWSACAPWRQLSSDRVIETGDLVAIDVGFFFDGYTTDFGCTYVFDREATAAEHVLARRWTEVADRVTGVIRPGATAADLRAAALDGWDEPEPPWPFGLYVAHGVGFGGVVPPFAGTDLGVEVERTMVLQTGDVLMIEPYVYETGVGGYRAERCVAVTGTGSEVFTTLPIGQLTALART
jgi:Xaa-Pro aminopeptidase